MDSDPAVLIRALEDFLRSRTERALDSEEVREGLRLSARAKWLRKSLGAQTEAGKRLKALETEIARALKRAR